MDKWLEDHNIELFPNERLAQLHLVDKKLERTVDYPRDRVE
jgi:hypothetical protein